MQNPKLNGVLKYLTISYSFMSFLSMGLPFFEPDASKTSEIFCKAIITLCCVNEDFILGRLFVFRFYESISPSV